MTETRAFLGPADDGGFTITMSQDGVTLVKRLDTAAVDQFITTLGAARLGMEPQIPRTFQSNQPAPAVEPAWAILSPPEATSRVLALRHTAFGWLTFEFSLPKAIEFADELKSGHAS